MRPKLDMFFLRKVGIIEFCLTQIRQIRLQCVDDPGANLDPWSLHLAPLYVLDRWTMSGLFTEVLQNLM